MMNKNKYILLATDLVNKAFKGPDRPLKAQDIIVSYNSYLFKQLLVYEIAEALCAVERETLANIPGTNAWHKASYDAGYEQAKLDTAILVEPEASEGET